MPRSPHTNWLLTGVLGTILCVPGLLALAAIGLDTGVGGLIAGMLMAAIPVPFYIALALWIDRFEPESPRTLAVAFVWGASIAIFFALVFNSVHEQMLIAVAGDADASTITTVLSAPIVEELAKGLALLLLFVWKRDEFDNVTDGIIYATMVGLGFAMSENVQYYGQAFAGGGGAAAGVFVLRGIMGPFAHPLYTSMTGIGFGIARETDRVWVRVLAPLAGLGGAIVLHAIWNATAILGLVFFTAYVFVMIPAVVAVFVIAWFSLRREAKLIRTHLASVIASGVLSDDDVVVVTSVRRRFAASANALFEGGYRKWIERRRFHALATELAFHAWRTSRDAESDAEQIRAELVDAVRASRARLGLSVAAG